MIQWGKNKVVLTHPIRQRMVVELLEWKARFNWFKESLESLDLGLESLWVDEKSRRRLGITWGT